MKPTFSQKSFLEALMRLASEAGLTFSGSSGPMLFHSPEALMGIHPDPVEGLLNAIFLSDAHGKLSKMGHRVPGNFEGFLAGLDRTGQLKRTLAGGLSPFEPT